jgi:hypothetical protein
MQFSALPWAICAVCADEDECDMCRSCFKLNITFIDPSSGSSGDRCSGSGLCNPAGAGLVKTDVSEEHVSSIFRV